MAHVQADQNRASVEDDDALMARVAVRDTAAFRILIDRHAVLPHRIAWRMLGDPVEAEDVAQESMVRLWQFGERWQAGGPGVAAWLTRVTTNLCLDRLRRKRFSSDEAVPERIDDAPLADAGIEAEQQRAAVARAIAALPERQRAAIILTYYEEMPNLNAAEILEMNIKAFESLLLRARAALKAGLAGGGQYG
ncbi:MAG: RNA polymerase sigma factor [Alphaproteobacteria bacterium]|nr:RNA polymerase sigma factor [Alphaproteobacteria bacterium]MDE2340213.1 RNA polymerase sigma factor [Alphaproteobacteria bacterium]